MEIKDSRTLFAPVAMAFLCALAVRVALLLFNGSEDVPSVWPWSARMGLVYAQHLMGVPLDPFIHGGGAMNIPGAHQGFIFGDRGIVFPHLVLIWLTGNSSLGALQNVHAVIDSLMVIPVVLLANSLRGRLAAWMAGLGYALFIPHAVWVLVPSYGAWMTWGLMLLTGLSAWMVRSARSDAASLAAWAVGLGLLGFFFAQVRSPIVLLLAFLAGWYLVTAWAAGAFHRPAAITWRRVAAFAAAGIVCIGLNAAANFWAGDRVSAMRNTVGHSMWVGIGQFDNPLGVEDSDASVIAFYERETGRTDHGNTAGVEYNRWLVRRGIAFIKEHPETYLRMVIGRAGWILFPALYMDLHIDGAGWNGVRQERDGARQRAIADLMRANKADHGPLSPLFGWIGLADLGPQAVIERILGYGGQVMHFGLIVLLGLGVLLARRPGDAALLAVPVVYVTATLAPFYGPNNIELSAYAAAMPVVGAGAAGAVSLLAGIWQRFFQRRTN